MWRGCNGAEISGVVALMVMADMTRGTGRFNFAQGVVATAIGLGAALSNLLTGLMVDAGGFNAGFWFLTSIAAVAVTAFVPETFSEEVHLVERTP